MSFKRPQRHRPDKSAQEIIDSLRAVGYTVVVIGRPVDIAVTHPGWQINAWAMLELKTPKGKKGELKLRKDQQEQQDFCAEHGVPYLLTPFQALTWLQENPR